MSELASALKLRCPVCSARFRGSSTCSRCGTDLTALMRLAAMAWAMRQRARQALLAGNLAESLKRWGESRRIQA